ncbi:MAG: hypothetical protein OQK98_09415 [Gammaproteobacteria bacterium]|nr:hypothetical protein [Gammaproteobacteria bacterium]
MNDQPQLHSSIVAMVSLASGIAANHPAMGKCQLERLRKVGIPQHQIDAVIEIARHIRDEAAQELDAALNECVTPQIKSEAEKQSSDNAKVSCCTSTASGQSCC